MLTINELKNGILVEIEGEPYMALSVKHQHIGRGGSSVAVKIRNLRTGQVFEKNFKPADEFKEAEIEKIKAKFLYSHRGEFWFSEPTNPKNRFMLKSEIIGEAENFLKPNLEIIALKFGEEIINIELPIKVDYKVIEAPPSLRGNTAQGGTKTVTIESGAKISAPLFINEGDVIRVNTQTGEYVERVGKK
ncbi:MAG: elongation factor P [Patescibacteria group bacterium]